MQVPLNIPTEAVVIQSNFSAIPAWMVGAFASLLALILFRKLGKKISGADSKFADILVDIVNLIFAASLVASLSAMPAVTTLTASIQRNISAWEIVDGVFIGGTIVLALCVIAFSLLYTNTESILWLICFGVSIQVVALFVPWVNNILSWWINYPIAGVWNFIIGALSWLPNIEINF